MTYNVDDLKVVVLFRIVILSIANDPTIIKRDNVSTVSNPRRFCMYGLNIDHMKVVISAIRTSLRRTFFILFCMFLAFALIQIQKSNFIARYNKYYALIINIYILY